MYDVLEEPKNHLSSLRYNNVKINRWCKFTSHTFPALLYLLRKCKGNGLPKE